MLSCTKIVKKKILDLYKHNIVIHASDLPKGKGFTPLKWQILEGENDIPITLFEAVEAMDAGKYYFKDYIHFDGHELLEELHTKLGEKVCQMAIRYVNECDNLVGIEQQGDETTYRRITHEDDELDINKTIKDQFNHFRIADNDRFPLWFCYKGHEYILRITKKITYFSYKKRHYLLSHLVL